MRKNRNPEAQHKNSIPERHNGSRNNNNSISSENRVQERNQVFEMARALLESADRAYCTDDYALNETFLFLYRVLWEYARESLSPKDYTDFRKTQLAAWQDLYM